MRLRRPCRRGVEGISHRGLISKQTAAGLSPLSAQAATRMLRNLPAGLERMRIDRQLEEALTSGADPLHLASVFGISNRTAIGTRSMPRNCWPTLRRPPPVDRPT
jgi:hypothetical protein